MIFIITMSWQFQTASVAACSHRRPWYAPTIFDKINHIMKLALNGLRGLHSGRGKAASPKTQGLESCVWRPAKKGANQVVKVKLGWHWLAEEEKMPFVEYLL